MGVWFCDLGADGVGLMMVFFDGALPTRFWLGGFLQHVRIHDECCLYQDQRAGNWRTVDIGASMIRGLSGLVLSNFEMSWISGVGFRKLVPAT
jgi:hypothetical protein